MSKQTRLNGLVPTKKYNKFKDVLTKRGMSISGWLRVQIDKELEVTPQEDK